MLHKYKSEFAGKEVKIKEEVNELGGRTIRIEDWWDRVSGGSWMHANGNIACLNYAFRVGSSELPIPTNNEVLYGKIDGLGYLVHVAELEKINHGQY